MDLHSFLSSNDVESELFPISAMPLSDGEDGREVEEPTSIQAFIVSHDRQNLRIRHLGTEYFIEKCDVVDVTSPKAIFGSFGRTGQAAEIRLREGATMRHAHAVPAGTFVDHLPFAFRVPTWTHAVEQRPFYTEQECRWLRERGLMAPDDGRHRTFSAAESSMTDIQTPGHTSSTTCGTASGTFPDIHVNPDNDDTETSDPTSDGLKNDEGY